MYLAYFDEAKFEPKVSPYFFLGGIILNETEASQFEKNLMQIQYNYFGTQSLNKTTELHGQEVFQGKGNFKNESLNKRMKLFEDVLICVKNSHISIRFIKFDVQKHRDKYIYPEPEYRLSLMLFLERVCDYLDSVDGLGIAFGDYEKDEIAKSILDFSQFKANKTTPMYFGRPLGRLLDSVYFTHSHYSRFLQAADMICYLCQRYEAGKTYKSHHDQNLQKAWETFKQKNFQIQVWP